jgi:pre-mRNA cleavage complex 2 protein Pcf11
MSARSPRGSLSGVTSDEVAEDFGDSLKELQTNDRGQISLLTKIAEEATEHAQAISRAIEHHINTVRSLDHVILSMMHPDSQQAKCTC